MYCRQSLLYMGKMGKVTLGLGCHNPVLEPLSQPIRLTWADAWQPSHNPDLRFQGGHCRKDIKWEVVERITYPKKSNMKQCEGIRGVIKLLLEEEMNEPLRRCGQNQSISQFSPVFSVSLKRDVSAFAVRKCKHSNNSVLCYWQEFRALRKPYFMSLLFIHV